MTAEPAQSTFMAEPVAVERYYERDLDGRTRALRFMRAFLARTGLVLALSSVLAPLQLVALLTLDLPLRMFDGLGGPGGMVTSAFLSRGEGLWFLLLLMLVLVTRRWGARLASQVITSAWLITLVMVAMLMIDLAPKLAASDLPSSRFLSSVTVSWLIGQYSAVWIYQLVRGGRWWRAPLLGAGAGAVVQALVYFPSAFAGTPVPWGHWLSIQLIISLGISTAFVLVYGLIRGVFRPAMGLGGR